MEHRRRWDLGIGERRLGVIPDPFAEVTALADYVAFYWDRVDHWYEEDDEIFVHARDPYKRVDVVNLFIAPAASYYWRGGRRRYQTRAVPFTRLVCQRATTSRLKTCAWTC